MDNYSQFSAFFYPKNIAVIGVSPCKNNLGKNIVSTVFTSDIRARSIPVGLSKGVVYVKESMRASRTLTGTSTWPSFSLPPRQFAGILEQSAARESSMRSSNPAVFSELGKEERTLEKACVEVARRYGGDSIHRPQRHRRSPISITA